MVDLICFIFWVNHQFLEFGYVLPCFAEIEWSEIFIEAIVDEVLSVVMGTLSILK